MATLTAYTKFDRNTIADGDALSTNIGLNASNDNAMLAETNSTYNTIKSVYDTVKANSATEWDNSKLKNFSKFVINGTTVQGKSKLADKFTFTANNGVRIYKNANNAYEFDASPDIAAISSYYKYTKLNNELALQQQDPFLFECSYFTIAWQSWAQNESYCQKGSETLNGFSKTNADESEFNSYLDISKLNDLAYSATTRILTSADFPTDEGSKDFKRLTHTIPWRGSFVYSNFAAAAYRGAAVVDYNSISYIHNNFAQDCSIAISLKGASAARNSFVFGDATNAEGGVSTYYLGMIATDRSTCFGPGAVAHNSSLTITPTGYVAGGAGDYRVSAYNKSIVLESCGENDRRGTSKKKALYTDNSLACQINGTAEFSAISSIVMQCAVDITGADTIQVKNSLLNYKFNYFTAASYGEHEQWKYRYFKHVVVDDSVDISTNLSNVKNSVCIGVKGTSHTSKAAVSAVDSVILQSNFSDIVDDIIKNSIIFGISNTYWATSGNNFDSTYSIYAGGLGNNLFDKNVNDMYAIANIMYSYDKHSCYLCTECSQESFTDITANYDNFSTCKFMNLPGTGNIAIKGNAWGYNSHGTTERIFYRNLVIGQPYINNSSVIGANTAKVSDNVFYQPSATSNFVGTSACFIYADANIHGYYNGTNVVTVNNSIATTYSQCYSNNSLSMVRSKVEPTLVREGGNIRGVDSSPNYCFAYAESTAVKYCYTNSNTRRIDDRQQLAFWHNTLIKENLPKVKFEHISELTNIDNMQENIYYIVG